MRLADGVGGMETRNIEVARAVIVVDELLLFPHLTLDLMVVVDHRVVRRVRRRVVVGEMPTDPDGTVFVG